MLKTIVAILTTFMLALSAAPLQSFELATADDTARFLAGLSPSSDFPLMALTKDPAWAAHARYFDSIFAREESTSLSKVREFSKKYLTDKHDAMLYMFSGPDFLVRDLVLSKRFDVCSGRPRTGRRGAGPNQPEPVCHK